MIDIVELHDKTDAEILIDGLCDALSRKNSECIGLRAEVDALKKIVAKLRTETARASYLGMHHSGRPLFSNERGIYVGELIIVK